MIKKLTIYITDNVNPYKNLAMEEYLTFHVEEGECILFLWQNRHTVVIGKNQNCWKECKVHVLEEDGGHLVRRLSGGGAVFHDMGNLNFTFCVREEDYDVSRQIDVILEAVKLLGIQAEKTGRNDITADGRKFSGNAFYQSHGFCYHHGTLLLDVDKQFMAKYLNVSREKLASKGVKSVKSRTVNLTELNPDITVASMEAAMEQAFAMVYGCEVQPLNEQRMDWEEIDALEQKFASWDWKYGKNFAFQYQMYQRFAWGDVELQFQVEKGKIVALNAFSDGMDQAFIAALPELWQGLPYEVSELCKAMDGFTGSSEIVGQMKQDITSLLAENM